MGKRIGVGVVGCGRISKSHLAAIKNLGDLAELVAAVDVDTKRAKSSYEEYSTKRYYHCHKLKKE